MLYFLLSVDKKLLHYVRKNDIIVVATQAKVSYFECNAFADLRDAPHAGIFFHVITLLHIINNDIRHSSKSTLYHFLT